MMTDQQREAIRERVSELVQLHTTAQTVIGDCRQVADLLASDISALLAENEEIRSWQPIETAPKDGTHILAYATMVSDEYDEDNRIVRKNVRENYTVVAYWLFGAFVSFPFTGGVPLNVKYTHWMPLPLAPTPRATGEET